jgi:hypothetical protein
MSTTGLGVVEDAIDEPVSVGMRDTEDRVLPDSSEEDRAGPKSESKDPRSASGCELAEGRMAADDVNRPPVLPVPSKDSSSSIRGPALDWIDVGKGDESVLADVPLVRALVIEDKTEVGGDPPFRSDSNGFRSIRGGTVETPV